MDRNRMISIRNRYTSLSDDELTSLSEDELRYKFSEINKQFPDLGCHEIISHLKNFEPPILLQRDLSQKHLSDVDPVGTARRWSQAIHWRQYYVASPNALWHIDSNHSLIRCVIS